MAHRLDINWMKSWCKHTSCDYCFDLVRCNVFCTINFLCDLSKAIRKICNHMCHLGIKLVDNLIINMQIPCNVFMITNNNARM